MSRSMDEERKEAEADGENLLSSAKGEESAVEGDVSSGPQMKEEKAAPSIEQEYQEKVKELEDKYLRLAAEFDNYKKRTARQFEEIIKGAGEGIIAQILTVVDDFHRALEAAGNGSDYQALHKGMKLIYNNLDGILSREGVERMKVLGEKFDPNLHDAMMQIDSDQYPEGTVAMEILAGYRLKGKVIRHARVGVSRGPASAISADEDNGDQCGQ